MSSGRFRGGYCWWSLGGVLTCHHCARLCGLASASIVKGTPSCEETRFVCATSSQLTLASASRAAALAPPPAHASRVASSASTSAPRPTAHTHMRRFRGVLLLRYRFWTTSRWFLWCRVWTPSRCFLVGVFCRFGRRGVLVVSASRTPQGSTCHGERDARSSFDAPGPAATPSHLGVHRVTVTSEW